MLKNSKKNRTVSKLKRKAQREISKCQRQKEDKTIQIVRIFLENFMEIVVRRRNGRRPYSRFYKL